MGETVQCPHCGHEFVVTSNTARRARMAWSNKLQRFVRTMMTDPEWGSYQRRGSID